MTNQDQRSSAESIKAKEGVVRVVKSKMLLPLSIVNGVHYSRGFPSPSRSPQPHQPQSLQTRLWRLIMLLCILAFVLAFKMHSQVTSSIEKLRAKQNMQLEQFTTMPAVTGVGKQHLQTQQAVAKKKSHNNNNQTIRTNNAKAAALAAAFAAAAKRKQNKKAAAAKKNQGQVILVNNTHYTMDNTNVPFVYMVFKRVDYLQRAIESLQQSDYPQHRLPIIISHDGRVPEVVDYVHQIIQQKQFHVIQLFHPYSCYEHADSFPGNDTTLNQGYMGGDWHGNARSSWATCCKHHFTWMLNQVFQLDNFTDHNSRHDDNDNSSSPLQQHVDTFLFMEEDYLVAPNVYSAIVAGLNVMERFKDDASLAPGGFLGLGLDPTNSGTKKASALNNKSNNDSSSNQTTTTNTTKEAAPWKADVFRTGPMTLNRAMFAKIKDNVHAHYAYCTFDDYNWDWSLEHLARKKYLPFTILMPGGKLVQHVGTSGGMHSKNIKNRNKTLQDAAFFRSHNATSWTVNQRVLVNVTVTPPRKILPGNGGWGHAADHAHCLQLFQW